MTCLDNTTKVVACPVTTVYPNMILDGYGMFWLFCIVLACVAFPRIRRNKK